MENIHLKSKEVLQPSFFKLFDDMTIINVNRFKKLITDYKMKMADEIPNAWNIINKLFNEFENKVLEEDITITD